MDELPLDDGAVPLEDGAETGGGAGALVRLLYASMRAAVSAGVGMNQPGSPRKRHRATRAWVASLDGERPCSCALAATKFRMFSSSC